MKMKICIMSLCLLAVEEHLASALSVTKPLVTNLSGARVFPPAQRASTRRPAHACSTSISPSKAQPKAKPREGVASWLLNLALQSPLWELVLVPQARSNIVKTAESNGIKWVDAYDWISSQPTGPWANEDGMNGGVENVDIQPDYYKKSFHAYKKGNLCWEAAWEQELASRAVGARNFPTHGSKGEDAFRGAFDSALLRMGGRVPEKGFILDMGCGTGTSARRLAAQFPSSQVLGVDFSPHFIQVGKTLLSLAPKGQESGGPWVTSIQPSDRLDLRFGDIANTELDDESVDVVNLSLVIHELPIHMSKKVIDEAYRILRPGGQIWISEMDFDSPAYAAQRENALLFSLLRATEPYLDDYADGSDSIRDHLTERFSVRITAATGRHYALVATKDSPNGLEDHRFDCEGEYIIGDTHLKPWESKEN